ncbi:MAG: TQO small subunit DoxD [Ilumatobacteraceae bacterium]
MSETATGADVAGRGPAVNQAIIGAARILAGLLWLANLHWKVPPDFGERGGGGLYKYAASVSRHSPFAPFTWVVEEIILPNFRVFGWITLCVELALAMLLLVGYRTRWVALIGAAMTVPILLSTIYYDGADEWSWAYFMMIGLHLLLFATAAGYSVGLDGVLAARRPERSQRALLATGVVAVVVGIVGLYVARNIGFSGSRVALLGSDAGFTNADGNLVRRWELKFVWFNPLWATLTIAFGAALVAGARSRIAGWIAAGGFGAMAVVVLVSETFDYVRADGSVQVIATSPNAAMWGAFAVVAGLLTRSLSNDSAPSGRDHDADLADSVAAAS